MGVSRENQDLAQLLRLHYHAMLQSVYETAADKGLLASGVSRSQFTSCSTDTQEDWDKVATLLINTMLISGVEPARLIETIDDYVVSATIMYPISIEINPDSSKSWVIEVSYGSGSRDIFKISTTPSGREKIRVKCIRAEARKLFGDIGRRRLNL